MVVVDGDSTVAAEAVTGWDHVDVVDADVVVDVEAEADAEAVLLVTDGVVVRLRREDGLLVGCDTPNSSSSSSSSHPGRW